MAPVSDSPHVAPWLWRIVDAMSAAQGSEAERMPDVSVANVRQGTEPTAAFLTDLFRRRLGSPDTPFADADAAARAYINLVVRGPANTAAWGGEVDAEEVERDLKYSVALFLNGVAPEGRERPAAVAEALDHLEKARSLLANLPDA